ncbi:HelD family protein [Streptomyces olivochromogenes]|uniref:HelD family protein n=1 Tax=Streptomyces olivochromogenes TaxID=1963 RepID=UPI001F227443|nr:AAA family ATPase [Streptomyces olivochromogenes]MCF3128956.1 AAA family ATPase [Streptomyces olivochromogenes]
MYALLDEQLADARAQLADVLKTPVDSPAEAHGREVEAGRLAGMLHRLEGAEEGLVFGRVDSRDGTTLHVGRLGLRSDDGDLPLLVDWRAEAARPFYAATPPHPMGLRRRRHLRVEGRTVRAVNDELLDGSAPASDDVVGDGPLVEALEAGRTGRMGAVVATLQAEQDAIVRSGHRGVTVVRGGPGTGKTVVALHRAAYMLYAFPRAAENGVLILGPNARFLEYVSAVLPSLGENDAVLSTCQELAGVRSAEREPFDSARLKGDLMMADALAGLVRSLQAPRGDFTVRVGQERTRLSDEVVARARDAAVADGLPHNRARELFKGHLVDAVVAQLRRAMAEDLARIDAEVSQSTGMNLDQAVEADLRALGLDGAPTEDPDEEFDADALRATLLDDAQVDRSVQDLWPRLTSEALVQRLLTDPHLLATHLPNLAPGERSRSLRAPGGGWSEADAALLDEAAALIDGPPDRVFGHVVVDEAQDLTAMQWRMVLRRCPARSMTLVGDFAQAGPAPTARDWPEALGPHLGTRFTVHTLTVNYRTTEEILTSTRNLLARIAPDQTPSRSIRHGEAPRHVTACADTLTAILARELRALAAAHPGELLAVICPDARTDELAASPITEHARLVPASECRGLEFDSVIVALPDEIATARPGGERDLYVALTRATKRLRTIGVRTS